MKWWMAIAALLVAAPVGAVLPDEMLSDPMLEARARSISQELRCVVCQNQSIDDSDAPLARDLRVVVREQLRLGRSDAEIMDYVVARYGNFVRLKPPVQMDTLLLWGGPFLVLLLGAGGLALWSRSSRAGGIESSPLTAAELAEIARLSKDGSPPR
ncbi:cytochrome c-type biogenesis protein [Sandarakinorhabdus sp.]|uniref:cytochrome c-type biogenesis protein n=1 Tax=Sandarakinorhabdus sp. TaxID=1916663 RepID=UPI00286EA230|nr:cytochrome c-type biogenesis protein [Sandarakinorhabdus sp.]